MGRIGRLAERYKSYIGLPWQKDLAGAERAIFVVYDKADERRLRARKDLFAMATTEAGHGWLVCDLTRVFAQWMAATEYRDSYFESPEDLELKLEDDFREHVAGRGARGADIFGGRREFGRGHFRCRFAVRIRARVRAHEEHRAGYQRSRGRVLPRRVRRQQLSVAGRKGWVELPRSPDHLA